MDQWLPYINIPFVLTASFFQIAVTYVLLHCFCDQQFCWNKKSFLTTCAYLVARCIVFLIWPHFYISALTESCIVAALMFFTYSGKKIRGIFLAFFVYSTISMCFTMIEMVVGPYIFPDTTAETLYENYLNKIIFNAAYIAIFVPIFIYLYRNVYKKDLWLPLRESEQWLIDIYVLVYYAIYWIQGSYDSEGKITTVIMGVSFVITALLLPIFLFYLRISRHHQERANRQEMHMQAELAHFQQYKLSQEETARFRHDIKNNLLCVNDMLQQGKVPQATQYLQDLLKNTESLSTQYVTGDEILDSILAFKSQKFAESGIQLRLDGVIAGGLGWKPVDICNVFANALDNAIEACEKVPQDGRYITMEVRATHRFWLVRIENPVVEKVDTRRLFKKKDGYTSKADPSLHGLGTYTMKRTVESYGGMLQAQYEGQKFVLEIIVDKQ